MATLPSPPRSSHPEREIAPHVSSGRAESVNRRYFLVAFAFCLVVYLFPFAALRSGFKPEWWLSYWTSVIDTNYKHQRQDADVVVFGDSTAVTNIDPVRMSRDLRRKVVVLPNVSTSLPVTGYDPLETYLRSNKQPQLIVFYFSAWDLDFMHNPFTGIVQEGLEVTLAHESRETVLRYAVHHPEQMLMFPLHFYATSNRVGDFLYFREHEVPRLQQGHLLYVSHPTPMKADCVLDKTMVDRGVKDTSAREAVARFTVPGTQTLVFISPLPQCKYADVVQAIPHPGLAIPALQVLPPASFRDDSWQVHMLTGKIGPSTDYLEAVIRHKLEPLASGVQQH